MCGVWMTQEGRMTGARHVSSLPILSSYHPIENTLKHIGNLLISPHWKHIHKYDWGGGGKSEENNSSNWPMSKSFSHDELCGSTHTTVIIHKSDDDGDDDDDGVGDD